MMGMKIRTTYDPKPIPNRSFDWSAVGDDYEPGQPIGNGSTENEAIADLKSQIADRPPDNGGAGHGE